MGWLPFIEAEEMEQILTFGLRNPTFMKKQRNSITHNSRLHRE
jgi:hypothetical protein